MVGIPEAVADVAVDAVEGIGEFGNAVGTWVSDGEIGTAAVFAGCAVGLSITPVSYIEEACEEGLGHLEAMP